MSFLALDDYRFHGMHAEGRGTSLEEAIEGLADFWDSRPSLVMHAWGVLTLEITIGGSTATIQITDKKLLDDIEGGNYQPLIDKLAADMRMDRADAEALLSETTDVVAIVDRIRPPTGPQWIVDPGTSPEDVLSKASPVWIRELAKEVDIEARRARGAPRSRRGKKLLRMVVRSGISRGLSDRQLARRTGVPVSTIRDTRDRIRRETYVAKEFRTRVPGQRLTAEQKDLIMDKLKVSDNNAAQVARDLGIPARTVRDLRRRVTQVKVDVTPRAGKSRGRWSERVKERLHHLVEQGLTPTEAARQINVPARTARGWVASHKSTK